MAILSVKELAREEQSQKSVQQDGSLAKTAVRPYQVITDAMHSPTEIEVASDGTTSIPEPFSEHPNDPHRLLKSIEPVRNEDDPYVWLVRCVYSNQVQGGSLPDNPLNRPPRIVGLFSRQNRRQIFRDRNGDPIVNTADQPYSTPIEVDDWDRFARIEANFASFSEADRAAWDGAINSNTHYGDPPGTIRVRIPSVVEMRENNIVYAKVTLELEYRAEGWQPTTVSQGRRQKVWTDDPTDPNATYTIEDIPDPSGGVVTDEMFLDEYGRSVGVDVSQAAVQTTLHYNSVDISPLNLPPLIIPTQ